MTTLIILFIFVPIVAALLLFLNLIFAVHKSDSEKLSTFECGIMPVHGQTRAPFSIQFYLVAILFLVFDLELLVLYPVTVTLFQIGSYGFWVVLIFFTVLTVGFIFEIGSGALYSLGSKVTNTSTGSNTSL